MKTNPNQLSFNFKETGLKLSNHFECEHNFYTDSFTDHEVCERCGLVVAHEYILEHCDIKEWTDG